MSDNGLLRARLTNVCTAVAGLLDSPTRAEVLKVRRRLCAPLRIVIAGPRASGKSTLVNAMLGRRVARTPGGDYGRVVTQFRHGDADRVEVICHDQRWFTLDLNEAGMIPSRLGVPLHEISYVDVQLATDDLRDVTIVDTPGLPVDRSPQRAREPVQGELDGDSLGEDWRDDDSLDVVGEADAILYVFTNAVDEAAAQAVVRPISTGLPAHPLAALGVFNKVDNLVSAAADPWPVAVVRTADLARALRRVVSDVVPVAALLAETVACGQLTAADVAELRRLARLPETERVTLLASAGAFTGASGGAVQPVRARLLRLLGQYGVAFAAARLVAVPDLPDDELIGLVFAASGFHRLRQTLDHAFRWRADEIKSTWALAALQNLASRTPRPHERELLGKAIELASSTDLTWPVWGEARTTGDEQRDN